MTSVEVLQGCQIYLIYPDAAKALPQHSNYSLEPLIARIHQLRLSIFSALTTEETNT